MIKWRAVLVKRNKKKENEWCRQLIWNHKVFIDSSLTMSYNFSANQKQEGDENNSTNYINTASRGLM